MIWHDVENGAYEADLELWRELALGAGGPVLEVGCGTGRVAIDLARHGHHVLGVDIEPAFVSVLRERAAERNLEASAEVGDVRDLEVTGEFALDHRPDADDPAPRGRRRAPGCAREHAPSIWHPGA